MINNLKVELYRFATFYFYDSLLIKNPYPVSDKIHYCPVNFMKFPAWLRQSARICLSGWQVGSLASE
jgi:hypothetical protein